MLEGGPGEIGEMDEKTRKGHLLLETEGWQYN